MQFRSGQANNGSSSELSSVSAITFDLGKYSVFAISLYPPSNLSLLIRVITRAREKAEVITTHSLADYHGPIYLDDLSCNGSEDNLLKCRMGTIGENKCSHEEDVSIKCQGYISQGGSFFIGLPASNWTTSSHVCSLQGIDKINTTDVFNHSSLAHTISEEVEKVWTGTVIKYTKWAAFIGCGRSFSSLDSGRSVKTMDDCLRHCSDYSFASYFVMKSSKCYCIADRPEINDDINDCRTECTNAIYTPCSSGRSALVFTFVEAVYVSKSWYDYQELCLKEGNSVLYNRNTLGEGAKVNTFFWTPIFRTHSVVTERLSETDLCVALSKSERKYFTLEHCSARFPFLCTYKAPRNTIVYNTVNNTFPTSVAVVELVVIIILVFLVVIISFKSFKRIRIYKEKLKRVNERLPGTEFSFYTGIEETNEEVNDPGYNELSDNLSQHDDRRMDTSNDRVDNQGYLISEQHYHTIPEVEIHYAEANVAESYGNEEHVDKDGYLEPVTK
ncbi:unnamed protein product [Mytilus coruscus]|uniref:SRCR domain-containing protein n=1 Tax=Mytilus coruscus TaxID=42192 RepID=A0A6J8DLJ1_MYTCO|nr:unnamed protein product [Mytilus coruscus]